MRLCFRSQKWRSRGSSLFCSREASAPCPRFQSAQRLCSVGGQQCSSRRPTPSRRAFAEQLTVRTVVDNRFFPGSATCCSPSPRVVTCCPLACLRGPRKRKGQNRGRNVNGRPMREARRVMRTAQSMCCAYRSFEVGRPAVKGKRSGEECRRR